MTMNSSASSRAGWSQGILKTLFVLVLVVAAFFAGSGIAQRRAEKSVREAQEAAAEARREQKILELMLERTKIEPLP
jgi:hypothetical protein